MPHLPIQQERLRLYDVCLISDIINYKHFFNFSLVDYEKLLSIEFSSKHDKTSYYIGGCIKNMGVLRVSN